MESNIRKTGKQSNEMVAMEENTGEMVISHYYFHKTEN